MTVKNSPEVHHLTDASSVTSTNAQQPQPQTKALRPKAVSQWTVLDVQKWLRRHCSDLNSVDYFALYAEKFLEQDITGVFMSRSLLVLIILAFFWRPTFSDAISMCMYVVRIHRFRVELNDVPLQLLSLQGPR